MIDPDADARLIRDQITAGCEALCACAFFAVIAFFWIGTP